MNVTINMDAPLLGLHGEPLIDFKARNPETGQPDVSTLFEVKVRDIIQSACMQTVASDTGKNYEEKAKIYGYALEAKQPTVEWPVEVVAMLKSRIAELPFGPAVIGPLNAAFAQ